MATDTTGRVTEEVYEAARRAAHERWCLGTCDDDPNCEGQPDEEELRAALKAAFSCEV